jgi:pyruvate dehydrogenase E2 component (dihydrolipoamide acetyltransferase)
MSEFRMPSLGADMESGRLVEWLKSPGSEVERGDIIAVVDTQKGAIEIEVFEDGVLEEILAEPGEEIPVGRTLAYIRAPGEPGREQSRKAKLRRRTRRRRPSPRHQPQPTRPRYRVYT